MKISPYPNFPPWVRMINASQVGRPARKADE